MTGERNWWPHPPTKVEPGRILVYYDPASFVMFGGSTICPAAAAQGDGEERYLKEKTHVGQLESADNARDGKQGRNAVFLSP